MVTNFITPPDFIETVVLIDASDVEVQALAAFLKSADKPYNVYLYNHTENNLEWLVKVCKRADVVLQAEASTVPVLEKTKFGENQVLKTPVHYFNK